MLDQAPAPDGARDGTGSIEIRGRAGSVTTAAVAGPLNRETAALCEQRLRPLMGSGIGVLALDLTRTDYVDSDGVRWLQRLQGDLAARRIELRLLVRPGSRPQRTLKLLQLERVFPIQTAPA